MKLVDTETPNPDRFARTADGKIDFDAYAGLTADYHVNDLVFLMRIDGSRQRFGHLDLLVSPAMGSGDRWVELKNLVIHNDPGNKTVTPVKPSVPTTVHTTTRIAGPMPIPSPYVAEVAEIVEEEVAEVVTVPSIPAPAPIPAASVNYGTHWTESTNSITPAPAEVSTEVVEESTASDMEVQVETILNEDSPVIK